MTNKRLYGFAFVDLVVLLVVLSVQTAVLYPLLEKSKESSRSSTCQVNLEKYASALQIYCGDWDGYLPSSAIASHSLTPTDAQVTRFLTGGPRKASDTTTSVSLPDVLNGYFRYPDSIYCPSDLPHGKASYWMKYAIDLAWRNLSIRKEGAYAYPSSQIIFYEHSGWHVGDAAGIKNGIQINVAYLDLHTATIVVKNGPASYPSKSDETSGASAIRLGAPMYYNYDNQTGTSHTGVADYIDPTRYSDAY